MAPDQRSKKKRMESCNHLGRRNNGKKSCGMFPKLPDHIFYHVFSKLPVKTVIQCRRVCKTWRQMLVEPYFSKLYHAKSTACCLLLKLCVDTDLGHDHEFHLLERIDQGIEAIPHNESNGGLMVTKFSKEHNIFDPESKMEIISSCNGLVLFCNLSEGQPLFVSNPITGEYTILPQHMSESRASVLGLVRFSSNAGDEYKVVRISSDLVQIHTLGTSAWTCISVEINEDYLPECHCSGVFLGGIFHWIACDYTLEVVFIFALGLESQQFQSFLCPSPPYDGGDDGSFWWTLGTKGEIFLTACGYLDSVAYPDYEVWMMKEYGNEESWTRLFVVEGLRLPAGAGDCFKVIKFLENDRILGLVLGRLFVYYIEEGTHEWVDYYGNEDDLVTEALVYTPSFISLKDYVPNGSLDVLSVRTV